MLYLITMCVAPWLLRQGQHIRVDIVLQALPRAPGLDAGMAGRPARLRLLRRDRLVRRPGRLVQLRLGRASTSRRWSRPEWWSLAPLPVVFVLLAIEMVFRMVRLQRGPSAGRATKR